MSETKRTAPLRRIVLVLRHRSGMFDSDWVMLECGHETEAWGDVRARCVECIRLASG